MTGQFQEPEEATMWTRKEINVFKETIRYYLREEEKKSVCEVLFCFENRIRVGGQPKRSDVTLKSV